MGKGFKHGASGGGGSGVELNFTVQAYPSEVELNVSTPASNTIGVVTTEPITGWKFSSTQPEMAAEGEVWFRVGGSSNAEFNALKENAIMVYPNSAKQYISGACVDKTAKIYQNGTWVDWIRYLFEEGTGVGYHSFVTDSESGQVTETTSGVVFSGSDAKSYLTEDKVSFNGESTLFVEATITNVGSDTTWAGSVVAKTDEQMLNSGSTWYRTNPTQSVSRTNFTANNARTKYALSIPNGAYHVGVAGNIQGTIHNIWFE